MPGFLLSLGIVLALFGLFALLAQSGNYVTYRLMRDLKNHGAEGAAVFLREEYASGPNNRMYFAVHLEEGASQREFHEYMPEAPGPVGTVVPVVHDTRNPKRARTGLRKDMDFDKERPVVLLVGGAGVVLLMVGLLLCVLAVAI
ncbi:DUF3592 domain-containing protein [Streptomyces griseofuscus]|uniref:DUF3592 domain-containing protein n=2 Tax=Streptomyces griseofuscus TaxID=146922 RepID=A0A7H1QCC2_9ACTN|nr:hypothetical protein HEP81_07721 [Streptomyces griseofuscus]